MQKINRILRKTNEEKIYYYDSEIYVKPIVCNICKCKFNNKSKAAHLKTEHHKIAVHLNSFAIEPIEDIEKAILQYKMGMKFLKRTFNSDSSSSTNTTSTIENNNDLEENNAINIEKIKHKTDVYARNLAHRVERYEKTKSIEKLVNTIQNSTKRLTNLQKEKYYYLLNKYPENEYLLSIKHLVPEIVIEQPKEPKPIKQPKIKQVKKKQKVYPIIVYKDTSINTNDNLSYPIIEYKDSTFNINDKVSYPTIEYKDNVNKISYPIIKYEHKL
jgi:hypothetical protein